jgi:hypothetical protein
LKIEGGYSLEFGSLATTHWAYLRAEWSLDVFGVCAWCYGVVNTLMDSSSRGAGAVDLSVMEDGRDANRDDGRGEHRSTFEGKVMRKKRGLRDVASIEIHED